jgi:3-phenylpropionate/trans-cinnamate dioxygenase ferredoxin subunit
MSTEVRANLGAFPSGAATHLDGGPYGICVVRLGDAFYAMADCCSHQNWPLSEGEIEEFSCTIECTKHGSTFSLKDGSPQCLPATRPVEVYPVRVDGDQLVVQVP